MKGCGAVTTPARERDSTPDKENSMFLGLRTVVYHVSDLDKAKGWYSAALGVKPYFDEAF